MKLKFNRPVGTPDPFIFEDNGRYYIYATAHEGVALYTADDIFGEWEFYGYVCKIEGCVQYWAPSVIKYEGKYYIYVSCQGEGFFQHLHVAMADSPEGPFVEPRMLYNRFSIDSHVVETESGLFLFYAENNENCDIVGTRVFVDRLLDPYTPEHKSREIIVPTFHEENFNGRIINGKLWHTIEGPFWIYKDGWHYLMYSGGCYENDTYHIGYSTAQTDETDLTKVDFVKHTDNGSFAPLMIKNDFEEGVGHHSVICIDGQYYAVYHGRDYDKGDIVTSDYRTARICKLELRDGIIKAERYPDRV